MGEKKYRKKKRPGMIRRIFPYLAVILVAAVLIVAVIFVTSRRGNKNREEIPTVVDVTESGGDGTDNTKTLEKDGVPEVKELVQKYFDAVKQADVELLEQIVEQDSAFSEESLKKDCEYIESYENIVCYTVPGIVENTYIVYVYYEIKFIGIETKAPAMIRLYVCQNDDKNLYIDKHSKDGEVAAYMQEVAGWESVRELVASVNTAIQEACAKDEDLKKLKDMLDGNTQTSAADGEAHESPSDEETYEEISAEAS